MTAVARYATARDVLAPNDADEIESIARLLRKPLMPWQLQVAEVATERNADGSLRYEIVMVTVPRQSGKTTLIGAMALQRMLANRGMEAWYTAQTGKDAGDRWNDLKELVQASPIPKKTRVDYALSAGSKTIKLLDRVDVTTGAMSAFRAFAPVVGAVHGDHPPLVILDEIWHWDETLGDAIYDGAIVPAQITLKGRRQVWFISTAGTAQSTFMKKWVERGRKGYPRMAYFEWSIGDLDDPYDVDAIARFHPAVGFTQDAQDIVDIGTGHGAGENEGMTRAEYLRAFCNSWTEALNPVMAAEDWAKLEQPMDVPSRRELAITYDVAPDNEAGRIMAVWRDADERPCGRVLHAAPGTAWMLKALVRLWTDWHPAVMGADDGGPTRWLTDSLRRVIGEDNVVTTGGKDFGTACEALLTYAREDGTLRHDGTKVLAREMAALVLKSTGDTTRFSRTHSPAPIAGLISFAVGIWLYDHQDTGPGAPEIYFPTGARR